MNEEDIRDLCRSGKRHFWVCFDTSNKRYLWWYPTREEAMERYHKHKSDPNNYATLSYPVKCEVIGTKLPERRWKGR